jgi:ribosomal protein L14E/L6E/L27E
VKQDLEEKGINCQYVYKMKNTISPLYVVITDNKTTLRDLESKAKTVEYVIIKWKKLINTRKIIQCHKCQVWGHAASNCHANPKCLKCAKDHLTSDCSLKKEVPEDQKLLKCQGHLANSTSCDVYLARKSHIEKIRASGAVKRPKQNANFVPAPIPVTNPWTTHRNNTDQNRNPAAAYMSALRSKLAEEVATQSTSPGPVTTNSFVDQETIDDVHLFLQIRDEIKQLKQKIDFKKLLKNLQSLNHKITHVSSQMEIVSAWLNIGIRLQLYKCTQKNNNHNLEH